MLADTEKQEALILCAKPDRHGVGLLETIVEQGQNDLPHSPPSANAVNACGFDNMTNMGPKGSDGKAWAIAGHTISQAKKLHCMAPESANAAILLQMNAELSDQETQRLFAD